MKVRLKVPVVASAAAAALAAGLTATSAQAAVHCGNPNGRSANPQHVVGKNIKPIRSRFGPLQGGCWVAEWVAFTQNDAWNGTWGHWKHYMTVCPHDARVCERWHYTWTDRYTPAHFTATNGRQVVTFELVI